MTWSDFGGAEDAADGRRIDRSTFATGSKRPFDQDAESARSIECCDGQMPIGGLLRGCGRGARVIRPAVECRNGRRRRTEREIEDDGRGRRDCEARPKRRLSPERCRFAAAFAHQKEHFREFGATSATLFEVSPQGKIVDPAIKIVGIDHPFRCGAIHRSPRRSSDSRIFWRPRNIRTLIVPSGHSRVLAISLTERPSQK